MTPLPPGLSAWHPAALIATWFGSGLLPKVPGTWGSLAALPFAWVIEAWTGAGGLTLAAGAAFVVGWWAAEVYIRKAGVEDPGAVVIDEVAAQWLVLALVPHQIVWYAAGFVLFRLIDIAKPWPVGWVDQRVKGGLGTMLDDLVAAALAIAILFIGMMIIG